MTPIPREAFAVVYEPESGETHEAVVSLTSGEVVSWRHVPGVEPPVILSEVEEGIAAVKADPAFREALAERGVTDLDLVHIELWPFGDLAPELRSATSASSGRRSGSGSTPTTTRTPTPYVACTRC